MTMFRLLPAALGALTLVSACGQVVSGVDDDGGSVTQFEHMFWGDAAYAYWFLLVVDDAPTEAARSVRQHLADDLRGFFDDLDAAECGIVADPGMYRPIDFRLIVVGSSGTLEPRFRESEGLYALGPDASPELLDAFEEAGGQAILSMETDEVLPFVGESEFVHYVQLVQGVAEPRSSAEAELAEVISAEAWPMGGLARTRPDESSNVPTLSWNATPWQVVMLDWNEDGYSCPEHDTDEELPSLEALRTIWSAGCWEDARIFATYGVADCSPACMSSLPAVDESGQVTCRVLGEFPVDVDCEESTGWTFVEQTVSEYESIEPWPVNLCELRQAEGAALDACIHDFACEGCEPSFCFRRAFTAEDESNPAHRRPTQTDDGYCRVSSDTGTTWEQIRMPHGADQVNGFIRVVCQK